MNPIAKPDRFKSMKQFKAGDTVFLAGRICAWCTVLWIGEAYVTRPWPNAPRLVEYVRQSVLRNTHTGRIMVYAWCDATAEGRHRVQEAS